LYGEKVMENNYQLTRIHNYVAGLMSKEEMYEIEREALSDPFLQDAIDGYKLQRGVDSHQLSLLQQRLARKIEAKAVDKNRRFYNWQRLTLGLAAAVLFLVACSLILFKHLNNTKVEKNTDVILMEQEMRINTTVFDGTDATPQQGWEQFNEELNSEIRDFDSAGEIQLTFNIDNGKPTDILISSSNSPELSEIVSSFIQQKVRWTGGKAGMIIVVSD